MDENDRKMLVSHTKMACYKAGENIRSYGRDPGILLVQSGLLCSYLLSEEGKIVVVYRSKPGQVCVLAPLQIIDTTTLELYTDAYEDSEVLVIPVDAFAKLSEKNIHAKNFLSSRTIKCLSMIIITMGKMLFTSLDTRLTDFLAVEAMERESYEIHMTHEQIASAIGSAREVVSRALKRMSDKNRIELFRGGIRILDQDLLQKR